MKNIIPINQNKIACQNKWAWSSLYLNSGTTATCHRCNHYKFNTDTISNFHNLPEKIIDRKKMAQGEWPGNGCEYCRDIEAVGGISDRIPFYNRPDTLIPEELKKDPNAIEVTPTILEVYFSNICNQACVYCRPRFSSQIETEVRKFGSTKSNVDYDEGLRHFQRDDNYEVYLSKFFEWMKENGHKLVEFKMLGGEPLYQEEFDMCLDFFENNPCPNLQWDIFTNLNHDTEKFRIKIEKIKNLIKDKKLKSMKLVCSIDCWGPDVEYVRYGFEQHTAEKNMELILETDGIEVQIHATITPLSLPSMYLLAKKWKEWSKKKFIDFHWNTVVAPACFDVYNFGSHLISYVDKFIEEMTEHGPLRLNQETIIGIKKRMEQAQINENEVINLYKFLNQLDLRRNEDWKSRFPDIVNKMKLVLKNP